jgi:hypothetical protein
MAKQPQVIEFAATGTRVADSEKPVYTEAGFGAVAASRDFSGF